MATTATATATKMAANNSFHPQNSSTTQQQNQRSTCGCGAASSESGSFSRSEHYVNERSSPVPVPTAAQQQMDDSTKATPSSQGNSVDATCNANIASSVKSCSSSNGSMQMGTVADAIAAAATTSRNVEPTPPKKSPKDFIFAKYIGEGSFSIVYLAIDVNTKREYAIKVCEKRHILRERKQEYIQREREVMHMMRNEPGFVNLSCTFHDNRSLYFVMTYAKNGDLLQYINKMGSFDVECTRHYAAELVLACEKMHRRNVVHRDLKPENILLDEDMHTLIADFGSAKILTLEDRMAVAVAQQTRVRSAHSNTSSYVDDEEDDDTNDTGSDDMDTPSRQPRYHRQRKGSFVGTAQYVSPEVLQSGPVTPAADLWALGCLIYQMISGLPPFRGNHDYMIFREILACKPDFPHGFDKDAEDLVKQLLKVNPAERLGAKDGHGIYESIRTHPFFAGIDFETVRQQVPPPIHPYLPGVSKDENFRTQYRVPENLEPGLDDRQVTRLLGAELGTAVTVEQNGVENLEKKTGAKNFFDMTDAEKLKRLEQQQKSDKWHVFADNEVILKKGFVNKRKGLFARKRMLLLTTGPRLIYIDPVQMVKKGEIPWSPELRVEPKNFKIFFVYTPNRTYYLEDSGGYALDWSECIDKMRELTYQNQAPSSTSRINTSSRVVTSSSSPTTARVKPMKASSNSN